MPATARTGFEVAPWMDRLGGFIERHTDWWIKLGSLETKLVEGAIPDAPVDRPTILETTALGAAWLAGMKAGVWPGMGEFAAGWARDKRFEPQMDEQTRRGKIAGWEDAIRRTLTA